MCIKRLITRKYHLKTATTTSTTETPSNHLSINGLVIDKGTGEILGRDDTPSVLSGPVKYKCELGKCRSIDDFEGHLSFVDRRKSDISSPPRAPAQIRQGQGRLKIEGQLLRLATEVLAHLLPPTEAVTWVGMNEYILDAWCRRAARMASRRGG